MDFTTFFRYEKRQWKKFSRMLWKGANAALVRMSGCDMKKEQERIGTVQKAASSRSVRSRKSARQDEMDDSLGR